jgi:hypothetical protein
VILIGVLDQTTPADAPNFAALGQSYRSFQRFVDAAESHLPSGAAVFQLPYGGYPERTPTGTMEAYEHLRPYFQSRALRWSFGCMAGSYADSWNKAVASLETRHMLECLARAGFHGVYVDRAGYDTDGANLVVRELNKCLGEPISITEDGRCLMFDLQPVIMAAINPGSANLQSPAEEFLHPLQVVWQEGFHDEDLCYGRSGRWGSPCNTIRIHNASTETKTYVLKCNLCAPQSTRVSLRGKQLRAEVDVNPEPQPFSFTLSLLPGSHNFELRCPLAPIAVAGGKFSFRIEGATISPAGGQSSEPIGPVFPLNERETMLFPASQ